MGKSKNKNRKANKDTRWNHQKAANHYKQSGGKRKTWNQPDHLQHFDDLPIELYTDSDLDPPLLEKPSLAHLDLDLDLDLDDLDLDKTTTNRFSVLDDYQPLHSLTSTMANTHSSTQQGDDGDGFYFDDTPADISFPHATIIVNGDTSNSTIKKGMTPSSAPDIQSLSSSSKQARKKAKRHRNKVQKSSKIISGDDIYIDVSSDDESAYINNDNNSNHRNVIQIGSNDFDDMTYTFQDESALDQDFIEHTDPDTWQQLQQWATHRSVDEQQQMQWFGTESDSDNDLGQSGVEGDGDNSRPTLFDLKDPIGDFGLDDSEDDEFIQQYTKQHQQQVSQHRHMQSTIMNTLPDVPASLQKGMYCFLEHNRRYTPNKTMAATLGHHGIKDIDTYSGQLRRLDRRIQLFLSDTSRQKYQLSEMTLYCRQLVQGLAKLYHIKVLSDKITEQKLPLLLEKCPKTQSPKDRRNIEKYINKAQLPVRTKRRMERKLGVFSKTKSSSSSTRKYQGRQRSGGGGGDFRSGNATIAHAEHGTVVGSAAAPLASNNIGHKLLAKMGWKEGEALGTNKDGIADPIQAVIRDRRRGLGA